MTIDMSQFYEVFFDEAEELLAEAEGLLLDIDLDDPDSEDLNAIFRAAHSIKGGAATFGFMDMTEITHVLENLLDKIRKNEMALTAEHVDAFLSAKDVLKMELDGHRLDAEVDQEQVTEVKAILKSFAEAGGLEVADAPKAAPQEAAAPEPEPEPQPEVKAEVIEEAPKEAAPAAKAEATVASGNFNITLLTNVTEKDVESLLEEIGLLGEVELVKLADDKQQIKLLSDDATEDDILAICSFIVDADEMKIEPMSDQASSAPDAEQAETTAEQKPEQAVEEESTYVAETPEELAAANKKAVETYDKKSMVEEEVGYGLFAEDGEDEEEGYGFFKGTKLHKPEEDAKEASEAAPANVEKTAEPAQTPETVAADKKKAKPKAKKEDKNSAEASSIRVGIEKVDQLINLVGELVITQAMIEQRVSDLDPVNNEDLIDSVGQLTRNTRDLQESVMSIRMMPMDFVFSRFPRMVRDLASKLKKKVDFVTVGATTELDKGLIERIVDPLTHLVRNSVDHGIENPADRKKSGKEEMGTLTLSAAHKGGSIVIEVTDDGGGLNRDKIMEKAAGNGIPVSENMSDTEVFNLIFAPGFSTAEVVTDVSGRGVGMDVVKRNITAMGGTVEIRSALGFGTTISIALPLTLAILDGMSVSLGNSIYVIPLNLIVETLQPRAEDIKTVTGEGRMVHVRGEYLPIIPLHSAFNQHTDITDPTKGVLVLIESDGKKSALFVDRLVGQQQVVIKSLETNYRKVHGVSGATIMGDGCVALILDVPALIQMGQANNYITGAMPFSNHNEQAINKELAQ